MFVNWEERLSGSRIDYSLAIMEDDDVAENWEEAADSGVSKTLFLMLELRHRKHVELQ